jgi:hypothetical protein
MSALRKRKPVEANDGSYGGAVLAAYDQMSLTIGTEHQCPKCGAVYFCDEDQCTVPRGYDCEDCMPGNYRGWLNSHSTWGGNRAKHDSVWAAKLARIEARMRNCSQPLQIASEPSPCDLTRLDIK